MMMWSCETVEPTRGGRLEGKTGSAGFCPSLPLVKMFDAKAYKGGLFT